LDLPKPSLPRPSVPIPPILPRPTPSPSPSQSANCALISAALKQRLPEPSGPPRSYDGLVSLQNPEPPLPHYEYGGDLPVQMSGFSTLGETPDMFERHFIVGGWRQWLLGGEPVVEYINQFDSNAAALSFDAVALKRGCNEVLRTFRVPGLPGAIGVTYHRPSLSSHIQLISFVVARYRVAVYWWHQSDLVLHDRIDAFARAANAYLRSELAPM
jgi:hypothetical protein